MTDATVQFVKSPNFSSRRGNEIDCIVMHHTGALAWQKTLKLFMAPEQRVSAHFIVPRHREEGLIQTVELEHKAWHCGRAEMWRKPDVNLFSVGIQLVGTADSGYTEFQYEAAAQICADVMNRHQKVLPNRIVGHESIADRGNGPGPLWSWARFFDRLITRLYGLRIERG